MSPLLLSTLLALAPSAPPPAAVGPTAAPAAVVAPAAAPVAVVPVAPAPAPPSMAPGPAPVVASAPVAAVSPAAVAAAGPAPASTVTVVPAGTTVTVNVYPPPPAVVVAPAPLIDPVAPIAPVVTAPVYNGRPDPAAVQASIHKFRRGAIGLLAIGGVGMGVAVGMQWARLSVLNDCPRGASDFGGAACSESASFEILGSYYSGFGMVAAVGGAGGAGAMWGKAAAHRDVQLRNGALRSRRGAKLLGVASIIGASVWLIGANVALIEKEAQCATSECLLRYRPLRYAANDAGVLGIAAGSALVGYSVAYGKQGRALVKLRASPKLTRTTAGISLSGQF